MQIWCFAVQKMCCLQKFDKLGEVKNVQNLMKNL